MPGDLIFHHYDFSNFAEKVRLVFGKKSLAWQSVVIPSTAPKPDYEPLTGGYRRTPALQVGADVYCDTQLIIDYLEARFPEPTVFPGPSRQRARAEALVLAGWAESNFLWPLAIYITGLHADRFPPEFHADRARLHGKPPPDLARVKASAKSNLSQLVAHLDWLAAALPEDDPFLSGQEAGVADFTVYHPLFLLDKIGRDHGLLDPHPRIRAWMERVAAVGQGSRQELETARALEIARAAEPQELGGAACEGPEDLERGSWVSVTPRDEPSPSVGKLLALDSSRIVLGVSNERVGEVHVHFPRVGYRIRAAASG